MLQLRKSNVIVRDGKPGPLSDVLRGRVIQRVLTTQEQLLIRTEDGAELRVSWRDEKGRMIGTPVLDDVRRWK